MIESYLLEANQLATDIAKEKILTIAKEERLKALMEKYCLVQCNKCGTILYRENLATGSYTTTSTETVYCDCGYGEDDEIVDVTYAFHVKRCPKCGNEIERRKEKITETNRRARNSNFLG